MDFNEIPDDIIRRSMRIKKEYNNIFLLNTMDGFFIFRPLTRAEYLDIVDLYNLEGEHAEDAIFERCVVWPDFSIEELYAGTVSVIANNIMNMSGFSDPDTFLGLLNASRESMELADSQMMVMLLKAFPGLTLEQINNLDIQQLTHRLALAEQILGIQLDIQKETQTKSPKGVLDFEAENKGMFKDEMSNDIPGFK